PLEDLAGTYPTLAKAKAAEQRHYATSQFLGKRRVVRHKPILFALALALLVPTEARADPALPDAFHGVWCGSADAMQRCSTEGAGGGFFMNVDATTIVDGKIYCSLRRLELIEDTALSIEYDTTWRCREYSNRHFLKLDPVKHFRIGLSLGDEPRLFMPETDRGGHPVR